MHRNICHPLKLISVRRIISMPYVYNALAIVPFLSVRKVKITCSMNVKKCLVKNGHATLYIAC